MSTASRMSAYLAALAARGRLSGAVAVTRAGRSYSAAFGSAVRASAEPNSVTTRFRLGSVSKQFTAMAILQLQAQHRLRVTDRVCRYLAACAASWRSITIDELLTHTSGIPDYLNDIDLGWPPPDESPERLVATLRTLPLHFRPGTRMRYSNSGYLVLGVVVQRVSGQPLAQYLQANIFGPLAMAHTGVDTTNVRAGHAVGYYADGAAAGPYPMSAFFGDGGLFSTVGDLQRWDAALLEHTLIPAALTAQMFAPHVRCPPAGSPGGCLLAGDLGYGFGWFVNRSPLGPLYQHLGRIDGYVAFNGIYPAVGEDVVVLANSESTDVAAIGTTLARLASED